MRAFIETAQGRGVALVYAATAFMVLQAADLILPAPRITINAWTSLAHCG